MTKINPEDIKIFREPDNELNHGNDRGYYIEIYKDIKKEVEELKQSILQNQELRKRIVDLADLWDGKESQHYGESLQKILDNLEIKDMPDFYKKENMDKIINELEESIDSLQKEHDIMKQLLEESKIG